jgi:hypothetical protein
MSSDLVYDYVIVGSGPSGSSTASYLAHALPTSNILVIEAGKTNQGNANILNPMISLGLAYNPETAWMYQTVPQKGLSGRDRCRLPLERSSAGLRKCRKGLIVKLDIHDAPRAGLCSCNRCVTYVASLLLFQRYQCYGMDSWYQS